MPTLEEMVQRHIERREYPALMGEEEYLDQDQDQDLGLSLPLKLAPVLANLADAYTTNEVLKRGGYEANPLMEGLARKPLLHAGVKAGVGLGSSFISDKVARKHPTAGKVFAILATAIPGILAINNAYQARKLDRRGR